MDVILLVLGVFGVILPPFLGLWLGEKRSVGGGGGFLLGLLLSWLGVALLLAFPLTPKARGRVRCPACKEWIHKAATVCPRCRTGLRPAG